VADVLVVARRAVRSLPFTPAAAADTPPRDRLTGFDPFAAEFAVDAVIREWDELRVLLLFLSSDLPGRGSNLPLDLEAGRWHGLAGWPCSTSCAAPLWVPSSEARVLHRMTLVVPKRLLARVDRRSLPTAWSIAAVG
jgi:hypothetical protein